MEFSTLGNIDDVSWVTKVFILIRLTSGRINNILRLPYLLVDNVQLSLHVRIGEVQQVDSILASILTDGDLTVDAQTDVGFLVQQILNFLGQNHTATACGHIEVVNAIAFSLIKYPKQILGRGNLEVGDCIALHCCSIE